MKAKKDKQYTVGVDYGASESATSFSMVFFDGRTEDGQYKYTIANVTYKQLLSAYKTRDK